MKNKKYTRKILAFITLLAIVINVFGTTSPIVANAAPEDLTSGVGAYNGGYLAVWSQPVYAFDGRTDTAYVSQITSDVNTNYYLDAKMDNLHSVNCVKLYPYNASDGGGIKGFPQDFTIQVSETGVNGWTTVASYTGYQVKGTGAQVFEFPSVTASYVRINATKLGACDASFALAFSEMEVLNTLGNETGVNELTGMSISVSSNQASVAWAKNEHLTDVDASTKYLSSWDGETTRTEWIKYSFSEAKTFGHVELFAWLEGSGDAQIVKGFPENFDIRVSDDGETWKTIASFTGVEISSTSPRKSISFTKVTARHIGLFATKLGSFDSKVALALGGMHVYDAPAAMPTIIQRDVEANWFSLNSELYANVTEPSHFRAHAVAESNTLTTTIIGSIARVNAPATVSLEAIELLLEPAEELKDFSKTYGQFNGWYQDASEKYHPKNLFDGDTNTYYRSVPVATANVNYYMDIKLNTVHSVNRVSLYPEVLEGKKVRGFPRDFTIQVSTTGKDDWMTVATYEDYTPVGTGVQTFDFSSVTAEYIRINATELGSVDSVYALSFSEIEVFNTFDNQDGLTRLRDMNVKTSSIEPTTSWAKPEYLKDIYPITRYLSQCSEEQRREESIIYEFSKDQSVGHVELYPWIDDGVVKGFPTDFEIRVSEDGENWETVASISDATVTVDSPRLRVSFPATSVTHIGLFTSKLGAFNAQYALALGGMLVYDHPAAEPEIQTGHGVNATWFSVNGTIFAEVTAQGGCRATAMAGLNPITTIVEGSRVKVETPDMVSVENVTLYVETADAAETYGAYNGGSLAAWSQPAYAFDGKTDTVYVSQITSDVNTNYYLDAKMDSLHSINCVKLYPYNASDGSGIKGFPQNFTIQVSETGVNGWTTVASYTGYQVKGTDAQVFEFPSVTASYVRINATKLGTCDASFALAFSEIEVLNTLGNETGVNELTDMSVSVSSNQASVTWAKNEHLTDVDASTKYLSSWDGETTRTEWIKYSFSEAKTIGHVELFAWLEGSGDEQIVKGFPENFDIRVSDDGETWTTVASFTGVTASGASPRKWISFPVVTAKHIGLFATKLGGFDSKVALALGGMHVYDAPTATPVIATNDVIATWFSLNNDVYADVIAPSCGFRVSANAEKKMLNTTILEDRISVEIPDTISLETVALVVEAAHKEGEWEVVAEPSYAQAGTRVKKCIDCNQEMRREEIEPLKVGDENVQFGDVTTALPKGSTMHITKIKPTKSQIAALHECLTDTAQYMSLYTLSLLDEQQRPVELTDSLKVRIRIEDGFTNYTVLQAVRVLDNSTELLDVTFREGYAEFIVEQLGTFGLVITDADYLSNEENNALEDVAVIAPSTGDHVSLLLPIVLCICSLSIVAIVFRRNKKNFRD